MELTPATDNWVDTINVGCKNHSGGRKLHETMSRLSDAGEIDPQTGFGPIIWDSWETNWGGS